MVHPILPLIALKGGLFALKLFLGHAYGFNRMYRNVIKQLKNTPVSVYQRNTIKETIKGAFRAPGDAYNIISANTAALKFVNENSSAILKNSGDVPRQVATAAEVLKKRNQ